MTEPILTRRELGCATLARQALLERTDLTPTELLERLVGAQAQEPLSWYTTFWTRLATFDPLDVSRMLETREVVRIALMRSTIHLVTARDALRLRPVMQPAVERPMQAHGRSELKARGLGEIAQAARELLAAEPLTSADLGARLAERWPQEPPDNLAMAARVAVPLVQVPPRGMWGRSGAARHTTLETWLGRPLEYDYPLDEVVLRYLAAFGPATPADAQSWSGLTRLRAVFDRLRPELVTFRAEDGRELFDLPGAPRPLAETPAPPRFLADYDNVLLGHADRSRFIDDDLRRRLLTEIGMYSYGTVLVDGSAAALWRIERDRSAAHLVIRPVAAIAPGDRAAVEDEAESLLDLWRGDAADVDVVWREQA